MKIIVDDEIPYIKGVLEPYADVEYIPGNLIVRESLSGADALLVRTWTVCDEKLLSGSGVRFVATATAGINHIDTDWCRRNGIITANAPGCNAMGVVQYLFTSLFHVAEKKGIVLKGKKLGIIGAGNIGGRAAALAGRFGMVPVVCDPPRAAAEGPEGFCSLDELLGVSDIVTLHVPLYKGTYKMADAKFFSKIPKNAIFVNASRGDVVDEDALLAVRDRLSALILDVWHDEPRVSEKLIASADVSTPHIAGYTLAGKLNATAAVVRAFARFASIPQLEVFYPVGNFAADDVSRHLDISGSQEEIARRLSDIFPVEAESSLLKGSPGEFGRLRSEYRYRAEFYV